MTTALRCSDNRIQQTAVNKWWRAYEKCCKGDNSCSVNSNDFCFTLSPETPCETSVIFPLFEKIMTRKRLGKWTIVAMKSTNPAFSRYEQSAANTSFRKWRARDTTSPGRKYTGKPASTAAPGSVLTYAYLWRVFWTGKPVLMYTSTLWSSLLATMLSPFVPPKGYRSEIKINLRYFYNNYNYNNYTDILWRW